MPTTEIQIRLSRTAFTKVKTVTVTLDDGNTISFTPGAPTGTGVFSTRSEKLAPGKYALVVSVPDPGPGDFPGPNDPPDPPPTDDPDFPGGGGGGGQ